MDASQQRQAAFGRNKDEWPTLALALWQPDRPHNFGGMLRLAGCLGIDLDLIEPAGFPLDDRRIRAASLDYGPLARWTRYPDAAMFLAARAGAGRRLVLLSTHASELYHRVSFRPDDVLLLGSEGQGVPSSVHDLVDLRIRIPMLPGRRSLNVVTAAAIVLGEAMRQLGTLDRLETADRP